jgi:hypothetical protein
LPQLEKIQQGGRRGPQLLGDIQSFLFHGGKLARIASVI